MPDCAYTYPFSNAEKSSLLRHHPLQPQDFFLTRHAGDAEALSQGNVAITDTTRVLEPEKYLREYRNELAGNGVISVPVASHINAMLHDITAGVNTATRRNPNCGLTADVLFEDVYKQFSSALAGFTTAVVNAGNNRSAPRTALKVAESTTSRLRPVPLTDFELQSDKKKHPFSAYYAPIPNGSGMRFIKPSETKKFMPAFEKYNGRAGNPGYFYVPNPEEVSDEHPLTEQNVRQYSSESAPTTARSYVAIYTSGEGIEGNPAFTDLDGRPFNKTLHYQGTVDGSLPYKRAEYTTTAAAPKLHRRFLVNFEQADPDEKPCFGCPMM